MKRGLVIRNVSTHDVPLDSLDHACVQAFTANGFVTELAVLDDHELMRQLMPRQQGYATQPFDAVLFRTAGLPAQRVLAVIQTVRTISRQLFLCVFSSQLVEHPMGRYECFQHGASMVTSAMEDVHQVLRFIGGASSQPSLHNGRSPPLFTCPICAKSGFTEDELWRHCPLYHINDKNRDDLQCPICRQATRGPFQVHLHNAHGPPGRGEMTSEFKMADSVLYSFALVVVHNRKYNRFLLVQEFANSGFWLPGGRIDSGENPVEAAIRETKEEAGIDIRLTGLLKMEYHPKKDRSGNNYVRMRFVFYGEPLDCDQLPKSIPDYESAGATWCAAEQVAELPLRGPEPTQYFDYVASGKPIFPLEMLHVSTPSQSRRR